MRIFCLRSLAELQPYADEWDRLSQGVPFRSWTWLSNWWRVYGEGFVDGRPSHRTLMAPCVFDESERLVGLGPWYVEQSAAAGRTLRMLGDGEVCSDYLSILSLPGRERFVAEALAEYLTHELADDRDAPDWDLMELSGIDAEDRGMTAFVEQMATRGNTIHGRSGVNCWRLELPANEADYYAMLSKSRRHLFRKLTRDYLDSGRGVVRLVSSADELPGAMQLFKDMLQRRRQSLGEPGSFASPRFRAFYERVLPALARSGRAELAFLEVDGRAVAADYLVHGNGIVYAYQGAIEPDALKLEPGKTIYLALLRRAIAMGDRHFDFLRGDEPYKANFRASPRPSVQWRIVPNRASALLRHNLWLAGRNMKDWVKSSVRLLAGSK